MTLAANISIGTILIVLVLVGLAIYGVSYVAAKGAKRGSRD